MDEAMLTLGAVAYDPKVITIWDGFQQLFLDRGLLFDYVLYTNYEQQVRALFAGHIQVAWNSPLAWLQAQGIAGALGRSAEAICMRDTDRDLTSIIVTRTGSKIASSADLKGKLVAVGASDSPQATLIPLGFLARQGLLPNRDFTVREFDILLGKHGDHIGGEREAMRALMRGECDAACILDANHLMFVQEGTAPSGTSQVIAQTEPYDHCNFTVLDSESIPMISHFRELLLEMSYADPAIRPLLDLEGLKRWLPGRTEGYALLADAVGRTGYLDSFVEAVTRQCS